MNYLLVAFVSALGFILCVLLVVQQTSVFVQATWLRRPAFDPTTVLRAARFAGTMMLGALLLEVCLVVHWRFAHGRLDWTWSILDHVDDVCGDFAAGEPSAAISRQPSAVSSSMADTADLCFERCEAFCRENGD